MKSLVLTTALALVTGTAFAQSTTLTTQNLQAGLELLGLSAQIAQNGQAMVGTPWNINGQTVLITQTNGIYTINTSGPLGTESFTPPANPNQALSTGEGWVASNNPANITFYGTNELDVRIGALYLQSSGTAVAALSVQKYGLLGNANVGVGGGILEGNNGTSSSGTAAGYAELDYRKPIGDVAVVGGAVGGYDLWHKTGFGGAKIGLEYRQNAHLGEWLDAIVVGENTTQNAFPFIIGGGISYAF